MTLLPKQKDLILKERVRLYNNLAQTDGCSGRLSVDLEIYPVPRIAWELEVLGESKWYFDERLGDDTPIPPLRGHWFTIQEPFLSGLATDRTGPRTILNGTTAQACFGDMDRPAHLFAIYLPNARFQAINMIGQKDMKQRIEEGKERELKGVGTIGRAVEAMLDDEWKLRLETRKEALNWLANHNHNIGSFITTNGGLSSIKPIPESDVPRASMTLTDAIKQLNTLNHLLSYANGGYLGPLFVVAYHSDSEDVATVAASALSYRVTPLNQLSTSWIRMESNLSAYLQCFSILHRMLNSTPWDETFHLILAWYLQSTSPLREWPIVANAIGTALERLSYTILVLEEDDTILQNRLELLFDIKRQEQARKEWKLGKEFGGPGISATGKRLKLLLERIGLTKDRGFDDTDDVMAFLDVRNAATHPRPYAVTDVERTRLLRQAVQWLDEIILWRLGYNGKYLDRRGNWSASTGPRYDLATRAPNW
jgi:hypothetical protein